MEIKLSFVSLTCAILLAGCGEESGLAPPASAQPSPPPVQPASGAISLMAILAHPDDEIQIAPTLAQYAREGADVTLVSVTRGDLGPGSSGLPPGPQVAALRSEEAQCAADALGIRLSLLDFGDGTLGQEPRKEGSAARQLADDLASMFAATPPDLILTFGPEGASGHADHRIVSSLVTEVVQEMAAPRPLLLYFGIRSGTLPAEFANSTEPPGTIAPDLLGVPLPYSPEDLSASQSALDCYVSQFDANDRGRLIALLDQTVWDGAVHYRGAFSRLGPGDIPQP